jgi:hypothetical protein
MIIFPWRISSMACSAVHSGIAAILDYFPVVNERHIPKGSHTGNVIRLWNKNGWAGKGFWAAAIDMAPEYGPAFEDMPAEG